MPRVTCPSGLVFEARTWTNEDTLINLDMELMESGLIGLKMVQRAAGAVLDPGPYPFKEGGEIDCALLTNADLTWAALEIRRKTRNMHNFDINCQGCGALLERTQDLNDVEMLPTSQEGIEHIRTGVPIIRKVEDITVEIKLIRGADLPTMAKLQAKDQKALFELQVCLSIKSIADPRYPRPLSSLDAIRAYWKSSSWAFREALEDDIDDLEGGPDLFVDVRCTKISCHREQVTTIPLDMGFFGIDSLRRYRRHKRRAPKQSSPSETSSEAGNGTSNE